MSLLLIAATLLTMQKGGIDFKLESETTGIDPARSVFVTLTLTTPKGATIAPPDLRARVQDSWGQTLVENPIMRQKGD